MRSIVALAVLLTPFLLAAQTPGDVRSTRLEHGSVAVDGEFTVSYRVVLPDLHAPDAAGGDGEAIPLVVVVAHHSTGRSERTWGNYSMQVLTRPSVRSRYRMMSAIVTAADDSPDAVLAGVDALVDRYPVDPARIYLVAEGMGADIGWEVMTRAAGRFAAAVLIGGDANPARAPAMLGTPLWVFHGRDDDRVPVESARSIVSALWAAGADEVRYSEFRGTGHAAWVPAWRETRLLPWLFSQRRE